MWCLLRAPDVPDSYGENGVAGEGGDDRRDNPADEHAGEGAHRESAQLIWSEPGPRSTSLGHAQRLPGRRARHDAY